MACLNNDISEKSYYYWLRKIRREVCEQDADSRMLPTLSALSFVEIPLKTARDTTLWIAPTDPVQQ